MANGAGQRVRLSVDIEPELRKRIKLVATERDMTVHDYVAAVLRRALAEAERERAAAESASWAPLSARAFARDWESEADGIYDRLS